MKSKLGTISPVEVRKIWAHEANEFTPWLAEPTNIEQLADALGLGELEIEAVEKDVGRFSADIVARDESGSHVLIENQLEQTDHRHLGQVITYLSGLDGDATIVWIATRFLEEHRAAIDWLNANTSERFDFFGVEIEVLRIGESSPAARFNVVSKPNGWTRNVGLASRRISETAISDVQRLYQSYWIALRDQFHNSGFTERFPKPWPRHWLPFRIGRSGFRINFVLFREQKSVRIELYLSQKGDPEKSAYHQLFDDKIKIESELESKLSWQELPERMASRVCLDLENADIQNLGDGPRQQQWLLGQLNAFRKVFAPRIRTLQLATTSSDDPEEESEV